MVMSVSIPSNLQQFILGEVAAGAAGSEEELVAKAIELYREMRNRHSALKADLQQSLSEADSGNVAGLDIEATIARGTARLNSEGIAD